MTVLSKLATSITVASALAPPLLAGGWQALTYQPPTLLSSPFNASTMFLLMDGRVLVSAVDLSGNVTNLWYILTPDASGSYVAGTWTQAASSNEARYAFASGVLADGRVIVAGGEQGSAGSHNTAEIYDPVSDTWTAIPAPSNFPAGPGGVPHWISDAPSTVLSDGRFFLGSKNDPATAIFNPFTNSWADGPSAPNTKNDEETWTLLPDGTVLSEDCAGHPHCHLFDPFDKDVLHPQGKWENINDTPPNNDLVANVVGSYEIGAGLLMYDGRAFVLGATGYTAHYTPGSPPGVSGTWAAGGVIPNSLVADDAPAAILPNGHVLCAIGVSKTKPTSFAEYDGTAFTLTSTNPGNYDDVTDHGRMLPLPTGEVLFSNRTIYAYTCDGTFTSSWQPTITSMATDLILGGQYILSGTQLNGLTTANSFGDECGVATNYPLVRLTYSLTGHVVYCRTFSPSTMGIATGSTPVSTHVAVPSNAELGPARLEVVANGIPSLPLHVVVRSSVTMKFDSLAAGVLVTDYPPPPAVRVATLSSVAGSGNYTVALSAGTSLPNVIETGAIGGTPDGTRDTYVDFAVPVGSLTFRATRVDTVGQAALVHVFENGTNTSTVPITGVGDPTKPVLVSLTAFHDVTRIEIVSITDAGGIALDDFKFCQAFASWTNYGTGYAGTLGIPTLTASAPPVIGTTITIITGNSLGNSTTGIMFVGYDTISTITQFGGTLLVNASTFIPLSFSGNSANSTTDTIPNDPTLSGLNIFVQCTEVDSGAAHCWSFTPGLDLSIGS